MTTLESSMNSINTYINEMLKCVNLKSENLRTFASLNQQANTQPHYFTITFMSSDF